MNPTWRQTKLIEFCSANNIVVTAFSPFGSKGASWGSNQVMDSELLNDIARAHGKSVPQVHNSNNTYIYIYIYK